MNRIRLHWSAATAKRLCTDNSYSPVAIGRTMQVRLHTDGHRLEPSSQPTWADAAVATPGLDIFLLASLIFREVCNNTFANRCKDRLSIPFQTRRS
jgi:hypothetical protein